MQVSEMKTNFVNRIEIVTKSAIICFIFYVYIFMAVELVSQAFNDFKISFLPIHVPLYLLFTIGFFDMVKSRMNVSLSHLLLSLEDEEEEVDERFVRFLDIAGYALLYFMFQLSLVIYFSPSFTEVMVGDVPFYLPLFIANCFIVAKIYNMFYENFTSTNDQARSSHRIERSNE